MKCTETNHRFFVLFWIVFLSILLSLFSKSAYLWFHCIVNLKTILYSWRKQFSRPVSHFARRFTISIVSKTQLF